MARSIRFQRPGILVAVLLAIGLAGCASTWLAGRPDGPAALSAAAVSVGPPRDWRQNPAIVEAVVEGDILAIGDVHGDYDRLMRLLRAGRVIAPAGRIPAIQWTAGRATLVFTGDLVDKGPKSLDVLALVQALGDAAAAKGGRVIVTMGNHEAEFLADPKADKVDDFKNELKDAGIAPKDVASGRHPLGVYLRALPFGAKVNDWFFCHAGNTGGKTIRQLSAELQSGVDAGGYGVPAVLGPDSLIEARLSPEPWWERDTVAPLAVLNRNALALGVQHVVMGHQPGGVVFADGTQRQKGEIYQKAGLIFLIDGGMSQAVDYSQGGMLVIPGPQHSSASVLYPDGKTKAPWPLR
ncbi:MAG: metallophosphoesterase [Candidatus Sericytochromatia bacterium]|nr:metallophosphoesterase [Candidatus Sericytochromatia bacterium]